MIDQLEALRELLEDATGLDVRITAGRPAAPSEVGQDCQTRIHVFLDAVADQNQPDEDACLVKTRFGMLYEIWTCYPEDWDDVTDSAESEDAATRLVGLMTEAWCALVAAKDTGYFCECRFVELTPLIVQPRSGGAVSALGGVVLPYDCVIPTSP